MLHSLDTCWITSLTRRFDGHVTVEWRLVEWVRFYWVSFMGFMILLCRFLDRPFIYICTLEKCKDFNVVKNFYFILNYYLSMYYESFFLHNYVFYVNETWNVDLFCNFIYKNWICQRQIANIVYFPWNDILVTCDITCWLRVTK